MKNFGLFVEPTYTNGKLAWWVTEWKEGKVSKTLSYSGVIWRLWNAFKEVVNENIKRDIREERANLDLQGKTISGEVSDEMEDSIYEGA